MSGPRSGAYSDNNRSSTNTVLSRFSSWARGEIKDANLKFYQGKIPSEPDGLYIDEIHRKWFGNMQRLEMGHDYIQWLFPIRESGQNPLAQPLQSYEARAIQDDSIAMARFVKSYEMMLHFYGMKLLNRGNGQVGRAENWKDQSRDLNHSEHNFLRITRILKSLGEMGLEHYKAPLIEFLLTEAIKTRELWNTLDSCHSYWIPTVKDRREQERLKEHATRLAFDRRSFEGKHAERHHPYNTRHSTGPREGRYPYPAGVAKSSKSTGLNPSDEAHTPTFITDKYLSNRGAEAQTITTGPATIPHHTGTTPQQRHGATTHVNQTTVINYTGLQVQERPTTKLADIKRWFAADPSKTHTSSMPGCDDTDQDDDDLFRHAQDDYVFEHYFTHCTIS